MNARGDFLQVTGQHVSGRHFEAPEPPILRRRVDPLSVVQMQNCGSRYGCVLFHCQPVERRGDEHPEAHQAGILHLQPDLRGTDVRVYHWQDVADSPLQDAIRIRRQMDVRILA